MKHGIIIANTGSPASPDPADVAEYLEVFLSNPRIVPINPLVWKQILKRVVLPRRSVASGEKYATIWSEGGFQFIRNHLELAAKLELSFAADEQDVAVQVAMSFGEPSIRAAMQKLARAGCDQLTVLPLYPQNAFSQAYIVADAVCSCAQDMRWQGGLSVIGDYSGNPVYLKAIADSIRASGYDSGSGDRLVMGFHSIPKVDAEHGDTYEEKTLETCRWLARELGLDEGQWDLGYQCRFDKGRAWLEPYSSEILERYDAEGFDGRVFYVCPNFSVDCLETYYDVERELKADWLKKKAAAGHAIREDSFVYIPCLGASDAHVSVIRDVIANPMSFIVRRAGNR